jgi:hypothetical protein
LNERLMSKSEKTSSRLASKAGKVLGSDRASKTAKSLAGSALTQAPNRKPKSPSSKTASSTARHASKTLAGSTLTQQVSTRRDADGRSVRVVLSPISSGSLSRDRVSKVVARVLNDPKRKR